MKKLAITLLLILASCVSMEDGDYLAPTGSFCEDAETCEGGLCLESTEDGIVEYEGGMCSAPCEGDTGLGCIDGEEHCLTYIATEESNCYQSCEFDGPEDQCREGYRCLSVGFLMFACMPPTPSMPGDET